MKPAGAHCGPSPESFGYSAMFEIVIAVAAAVSVSIFLVHVIEAYLTH
jgi:hypothetical protein